jgi:hypothetical protein
MTLDFPPEKDFSIPASPKQSTGFQSTQEWLFAISGWCCKLIIHTAPRRIDGLDNGA